MSFNDLIHDRYSCRAYTEEPVTTEELSTLLEAVRVAPTGKNTQSFHVWVFRSPEAVEKIKQCTLCHFGAPLFVLIGADPTDAFVRRGDDLNFCQIDATIVATHYMLAAESIGLNTCWVGLLRMEKIWELFPQTRDYVLVGLFPTGHADPEKAAPSPMHTQSKPIDELVTEL